MMSITVVPFLWMFVIAAFEMGSQPYDKSAFSAMLQNPKNIVEVYSYWPESMASVDEEDCSICLDHLLGHDRQKLAKCGHAFHKRCIETWFSREAKCPICSTRYGPPFGDQPEGGRMTCRVDPFVQVAGYQNFGCIRIEYHMPDGTQGPNHPKPGKRFSGTYRIAYLPDTEHGRIVAALLKVAFDRRLIFTVGTSITTGQSDCIVWNNIHHKTTLYGGPYGYPDPTYLQRVEEELKIAGIDRSML